MSSALAGPLPYILHAQIPSPTPQNPKLKHQVVLRGCLAGATLASCLIALSPSVTAIILSRGLAGVFAASIPVAQVFSLESLEGPPCLLQEGESSFGLGQRLTSVGFGVGERGVCVRERERVQGVG